MKSIKNMSQAEIAAYVQTQLRKANIDVVLSGGAAVGIYTNGMYVSMDIDLVNTQFTQRKTIEEIMKEIGFNPVGRHFEHPGTEQIIEFPPGFFCLVMHELERLMSWNLIQAFYGSSLLRIV